MDAEVDLLVEWLRTIGTTYAQATAPSDDNTLGMDMARLGGNRPATRRQNTPWAKRRRVMQDYAEYVSSKLRIYCHWHQWVP